MMELIIEQLQSSYFETLVWTLGHSLWQGLIVYLLVKLIFLLVEKQDAKLRHSIVLQSLFIFFLGMVITFFWVNNHVDTSIDLQNNSNGISYRVHKNDALQAPIQEVVSINGAIFYPALLWLMGVFLLSTRLIFGLFYIRRLRTNGIVPLADPQKRRWGGLAVQYGIRRKVDILFSRLVDSPLTFGHFKPVILVPASLLSGLEMSQIELIIVHELQHIRRNDYIINLLQSILEVVLFFNPFVWWLSREIRKEREHCCDDAVIRSFDPIEYANTLTKIEEHRIRINRKQLLMSATNNKNQLLIRIKRMIETKKERSGKLARVTTSMVLLASIFFISWVTPKNQDTGIFTKNEIEDTTTIDHLKTEHKDSLEWLYNFDFQKIDAKMKDVEKYMKDIEKLLNEKDNIEWYMDPSNIKTLESALERVEDSLRNIDFSEIEYGIKNAGKAISTIDFERLETVLKAANREIGNETLSKIIDNLKRMGDYINDNDLKTLESNLNTILSQAAPQSNSGVGEKDEEWSIELENELINDRLINDRHNYSFIITTNAFYINDKKQSKAMFKKYKKIVGTPFYSTNKSAVTFP